MKTLSKTLKMAIFIVVLVRVGAAFYMFINPFFGWIISMVLDYLDAVYLDQIYKMGRERYEIVDKYIDMAVNFVMMLVGIKYNVVLPLIMFVLFRLIGQCIYWKTNKEIYLIAFPNFFESFWVWSIALPFIGIPHELLFLLSIIGLILLMFIKFIQEIFVHYIYPKYLYEISMNFIWKPIHKILNF